MTNTENSSSTQSHGKLIAVVVAAAVVIILAVLSAFVWPGWAIKKDETSVQGKQQAAASAEPTKPTIEATALPDDATELLKAMPDSVLNYARTKAEASTTWTAATPLEEYTLTYSTGDKAKDVTLIIAQWSASDNAKTQYDALASAQTGDELAAGNVKVSGSTTGSYAVNGGCLGRQERRGYLAERYRGVPGHRCQGRRRAFLPEVPAVKRQRYCANMPVIAVVAAGGLRNCACVFPLSGNTCTIGRVATFTINRNGGFRWVLSSRSAASG